MLPWHQIRLVPVQPDPTTFHTVVLPFACMASHVSINGHSPPPTDQASFRSQIQARFQKHLLLHLFSTKRPEHVRQASLSRSSPVQLRFRSVHHRHASALQRQRQHHLAGDHGHRFGSHCKLGHQSIAVQVHIFSRDALANAPLASTKRYRCLFCYCLAPLIQTRLSIFGAILYSLYI